MAEMKPRRLDVDVVRTAPSGVDVTPAESDSNSPGTLVGNFTVFGDWYEINSAWEGHFVERTAPGAFQNSINNRNGKSPVRVLLEHGMDPTVGDKPLGVPSVLEERSDGVYGEVPLFDTSYNRDLAPALAGGAYGQSFRFQVQSDEWVEPDADSYESTGNARWDKLPQRTITEVGISEFGPTVWPASPSTNASTGLRSQTDSYYDALKRRDASAYDAAVRSVQAMHPENQEPENQEETRSTVNPEMDEQDNVTEETLVPPAVVERSEDSKVEPTVEVTTSIVHSSERTNSNMADMFTIEERSSRVSEIDARLAEIDKEAGATALRSEIQTEWDTLVAEKEEHERSIVAAEARAAYLKSGAEATARRGDFGTKAPAVHVKGNDIYDVAAVRRDHGNGPEAARVLTDNAKRAIEIAKFPGTDRARSQEKAARIIDSVDDAEGTLAKRFLNTGSDAYDRAFGKAVLQGIGNLNGDEHRALSLGTDASGGFAVPFQLDPTIIATNAGVINPLRNLARNVQVTGKVWEGVTSAGVTVSRAAEAAEASDNSPTLAQPSVATSRVQGFVPFSYELDYTWANLRGELGLMLGEAKDIEEAGSFLTGSGTAPQPQGILTGATNTIQTGTTLVITRADLYGVVESLSPRWRARGEWLAGTHFFNMVRELNVSYVDFYASIHANASNTPLLGYPSHEHSGFATIATTVPIAVFGDFSQFVIADRVGMNVELIPQVFGTNGRPTGQRGIYATWFNGSKVLVPSAFNVLVSK